MPSGKRKKANSVNPATAGKPKKVRGRWHNLDPAIPRRSVFTSSYVPNVDGWAQDVEGQIARDISIAAARAGLTDGDTQHAELHRVLPEPLGGFLADFYLVYLELFFDDPGEDFVIDERATGVASASPSDPFYGILQDAREAAEAQPFKSIDVLDAAKAIEGVPMTVEDDPDEESDPDFARRAAEMAEYAKFAEGEHEWRCFDCGGYFENTAEARSHAVALDHRLQVDDGALEDSLDDGEG